MGAPCFGLGFCFKNHYPRSREHFLIPSAHRHTHPFGGLGLRSLSPLMALWPPVFAGEQDVGPLKGRDVGQELGLDDQAGVVPLSDRFTKMGGIPANHDGSEQVEPGRTVVLP